MDLNRAINHLHQQGPPSSMCVRLRVRVRVCVCVRVRVRVRVRGFACGRGTLTRAHSQERQQHSGRS